MHVIFNAISLLLIGLIAVFLFNSVRQSSPRINRLFRAGLPTQIVVKVLPLDEETSGPIVESEDERTRMQGFQRNAANPADERGDNGWPAHVIRYTGKRMFRTDAGLWEHNFLSALERACYVLEALGQAKVIMGGAQALEHPCLPDSLPRWDDTCLAVLWLAYQFREIEILDEHIAVPLPGSYPLSSKANPGSERVVTMMDGRCQARLKGEALPALEAMGLIDGNFWSESAEVVLWRFSVWERNIDFASDQRFLDVVEQSCLSISPDVRAELNRLLTFDSNGITAWA